MKLSYRYIKKAKTKLASGRKLKPWERISISAGERRLTRRSKSKLRIASAAMAVLHGAFRIATIKSTIGYTPQEKALAIVEQSIQTSQQIGKSFQL